ncbi:MAG: ribose 5-phosphate isomerase B [Bacteriovoracaceae bacterium]
MVLSTSIETLLIASDHAGYMAKVELVKFIREQFPSVKVLDLGPSSDQSVNYPEFAIKLCNELLVDNQNEKKFGILICGTGIGMSITANRFKGVRAALCKSVDEAKLSREHNNANVLCLGSRSSSLDTLKNIVIAWFSTDFAGGRHAIRVNMIP